MGRTKKRHRVWKQQMRAKSKSRNPYHGISPGRLVAWVDGPEQEPKIFYPSQMESNSTKG